MRHDNNAECEGGYEMPTLTSELEVLIATTVWLVRNDWNIEAISVAGGHGLPPVGYQKEEIRKAFNTESVTFDNKMFKHRGPDIIARSHEGIWKIECKGLGKGKASTHRTNFVRASDDDDPIRPINIDLGNVSWKLVSLDLEHDLALIDITPADEEDAPTGQLNGQGKQIMKVRSLTAEDKQALLDNVKNMIQNKSMDELYRISKSARLKKPINKGMN